MVEAQKQLIQAQKSLMAGDFKQVETIVSSILEIEPDHKDALYMTAVNNRYQGRLKEALTHLNRLLSLAPSFGRALQELGYVYKAQGHLDKAIMAFEQSVISNPALTGAWLQLITLYQGSGKPEKAREADSQLTRMKNLPKELLAVSNYLYEDKILKAETLCRAFLKVNPTHGEAMRLLAEIASRYGVLDEAEFLLSKAIGFSPDTIQLKLDLIQVLRKSQQFNQALLIAEQLVMSDEKNPVFQSHYAIQAMQAGQYDLSLEFFDKVLKKLPKDAATHTSKGHALKTLGRRSDAIKSYKAACDLAPTYGDAWYGLANLKTYKFQQEEIAEMEETLEQTTMNVQAKVQIHFSLGKAYEDQEKHDQSFHHYAQGNTLRYIESRYNPDQMDEEFQEHKSVLSKDLLANYKGKGSQKSDPIFIVGLPRAGSTLIEQILASHSQVDGTMELPNIIMIAQEMRGRQKIDSEEGYPRNLKNIQPEKLFELGEKYIADTKQHRETAPFFTDKMPNNFRHIDLIKMILPNAKIIDARRDALACCFSGFKQLFAEGQEFSYSLESIGRYYRGYVELMDHFDTVMPGAIHRIHYEDMINDSEDQIRKLLAYCELPFEENCLNFHKTKRAVKTASSEQVREKINTRGLNAWKPFEKHLDPLKRALGLT
ncbi:sulfotransferase [Temperatibacter marinus]|uniref:Sulfotransferase n=1 Tax=Temperatibacter marinus TaxID=1456591 RepID=A0AA52EH84_9PROT|nr:sulfotransferase [Temperatibacter marinus]WND02021.1 sulfotransferase [Temperatibacter marinus]